MKKYFDELAGYCPLTAAWIREPIHPSCLRAVESSGGSPPLRTERDGPSSPAEHFSSPEKEEGGGGTIRADEMPLRV